MRRAMMSVLIAAVAYGAAWTGLAAQSVVASSMITSPLPGEAVRSGEVSIIGTAACPDFRKYELRFSPELTDVFVSGVVVDNLAPTDTLKPGVAPPVPSLFPTVPLEQPLTASPIAPTATLQPAQAAIASPTLLPTASPSAITTATPTPTGTPTHTRTSTAMPLATALAGSPRPKVSAMCWAAGLCLALSVLGGLVWLAAQAREGSKRK